ncbi:hypothetical protein Glove_482g33 [Diversispora epigaea]|uniref:Uncharacterized protein n=1 Tax=Diversispora epigaea TaxID=1348612 RepID=A0A397GJN3_9GLOM|nr:hypothetical protein Glove_482g33 [Diversispora epigaea]
MKGNKEGEADDVLDRHQQQQENLLSSFFGCNCEFFNLLDDIDDELDFDTKEQILKGISIIWKHNKFKAWLTKQADLVDYDIKNQNQNFSLPLSSLSTSIIITLLSHTIKNNNNV